MGIYYLAKKVHVNSDLTVVKQLIFCRCSVQGGRIHLLFFHSRKCDKDLSLVTGLEEEEVLGIR